MDRRIILSPESAEASDIFDKFCTANTLKGIISHYRQLCQLLRIKATHFPDFYPRLKVKLCSWRAQGLWTKIEKRASAKCYARGKVCASSRVLIIGAGPCGLRTAIEAQLLGAKVVLIEKRDRFSRNNVLHLWPFVITDLKGLGAKKFYGKFCAGSIDHISIRQIQCILLKVALLLGVEIHEGVGFEGLCEPSESEGWRAITSPTDHPVSHYNFDCLVGADGRRNTLEGFRRKALRAKLAIAITANFINKRTEAEARVKEISGVSYIFNQKFFQDLNEATGIDLENIVYYKDETHYFVMTAKKQSLLNKGVLLQDYADTAKLLSHENISTENLMVYSVEAALFSTENQFSDLEFAVNHYGQPDVAMFDFTAMYAAENACRVLQRKGHKLMMTLVGDSLLEPFWPTGSGCARGFLSSFDACWMLRSWASGTRSVLDVIAERESIYRLLGQTTPENLNKEHMGYTIDPHSRYPNLNLRVVMPFQVKALFDTDEKFSDVLDSALEQHQLERQRPKRRRDSVVAVDSLLGWLRKQVGCYGLEINDVYDAFARGDVLCAIIYRFRPDLIDFPSLSEENVDPLEIAACRNQIAFDFLQTEYGITPVVSGPDSVQTDSFDYLTMVAYLSQIYETFKGEIPQIKYLRVDGSDDTDEIVNRSSHVHQGKHVRHPAVVAKHGLSSRNNRRARLSSASRGLDTSDLSESSKRHRKRRSDERSRGSLGREVKATAGSSQVDFEKQYVPGLARDLEEKLKGSKLEKKPKDLIRAIGKIEKSDWNVLLIEKKIAESKACGQGRKERDDKVPKWSREAFDDKREAMKRRMEGAEEKNPANDKDKLFEDTMKKLGCKLKDGNALEVGQRGANKVSLMAGQIVNKLEKRTKDTNVIKPMVPRTLFEPTRGGSEVCHFCDQRVYVVERMTAEGKFFHRNCFRCEYCNTSLRLGNYSFDREGRYGERFYCTPHFQYIRHYGWKKYDQENSPPSPPEEEGQRLVLVGSQQLLSEMDERGTTPERVEFENSVDFASEEELLSEMDEDEWTDRNFGASKADNNTSDEASELSDDDDDDVTPEGEGVNGQAKGERQAQDKETESSDSDTEVASGDGSYEEDSEEGEEDGDEEEERGGSTTEIETDSEFAEDPPQSVPGRVPTIVVDEPEQLITRFFDAHHPKPHPKRNPYLESKNRRLPGPSIPKTPFQEREEYEELRVVEPVLKFKLPETRALPRVYAIPKKWEPLPEDARPQDVIAAKKAIELKKQYLHGTGSMPGLNPKKPVDTTTQNQFSSVLDMISEQQKRLQPAPKPSLAMQAFLDETEKLKNKGSIFSYSDPLINHQPVSPRANQLPPWSETLAPEEKDSNIINTTEITIADNTLSMNRLNIEKSLAADKKGSRTEGQSPNEPEKGDSEKELGTSTAVPAMNAVISTESALRENTFEVVAPPQSPLLQSEPPSYFSQSQTESQCTVIPVVEARESDSQEDEDTESGGGGGGCSGEELRVSDLDDDQYILDEMDDEEALNQREPPRVEIEDEFGVTLALDLEDTKKVSNGTKSSSQRKRNKKGSRKESLPKTHHIVSSSDSKDSLNSALFLETEMSDWAGEAAAVGGNRRRPPRKMNLDQPQPAPKIERKGLGLDLDGLDYMDIDGLSSPDELLESISRKKGYSRLFEDDGGNSSILVEGAEDASTSSVNESSTESSTPTLDCSMDNVIQPTNQNKTLIEPTKTLIEPTKTLIEAINPHVIEKNQHFPLLDRVVPFSNARDSLDYRKRKGITSPTKSKDLFSIYLPPESNSRIVNYGLFSAIPPSTTSSSYEGGESLPTDAGMKSATSPNTARKLNEISRERAKENELIRLMVLGRIRKNSEKNRRGSRGSLTHLASGGEGSSSSPSVSSSSELKTDGQNENSNGSSQASILSRHTDSEDEMGISYKTHDNMLLSPIRIRTRPIFASPLRMYQSVTNPPTPVNPTVGLAMTPVSPDSESLGTWEGLGKNPSPSFYGSMPNISLILAKSPTEARSRVNKVSSFTSPSPKKWEDYKHIVSVDRERARQAARERARLKSDEELGLKNQEQYFGLKKLRRKLSVPEERIFNFLTTDGKTSSELRCIAIPVTNQDSSQTLPEKSEEGSERTVDPIPVAASIRHNVDFPMRRNPFLVTTSEDHRHPHYKRAYSVDSKSP